MGTGRQPRWPRAAWLSALTPSSPSAAPLPPDPTQQGPGHCPWHGAPTVPLEGAGVREGPGNGSGRRNPGIPGGAEGEPVLAALPAPPPPRSASWGHADLQGMPPGGAAVSAQGAPPERTLPPPTEAPDLGNVHSCPTGLWPRGAVLASSCPSTRPAAPPGCFGQPGSNPGPALRTSAGRRGKAGAGWLS